MNRYRHTGLFAFEAQTPGNDDEASAQEFVIPEDLAELSDDDLDEDNDEALIARMIKAFDDLYTASPGDVEATATLNELAETIESLRGERTGRETARAEAQTRADELHARIHGSNDDDDPEDDDETDDAEDAPPADVPAEAVEEKEKVAVAAAAPPRQSEPAKPARRSINVPLAEIARRAPKTEARPALAITAAADVPHFQAGHTFNDISELAEAFHARAQSTPVSASGNPGGPKVASIRQEFRHVVSRDTAPADMEAMIKELTQPQALVAAGGWCAPSTTSYSFFDIACDDGLVDLPTFGVDRGGIRFPVSPTMADVYTGTMDVTTNPWLWTESDDILTITGSGVKPCVRVPCATFVDNRLECYGICLTAGNLTDSAWPEATAHFLGLLRSAHFHAQNARYLAAMVAGSTVVAAGGFGDSAGSIAADLPALAGWAAVDYRTRYGMCVDDIVEIVLPSWALEVARSDMALRTGVDKAAVSDAEIRSWFDVRNIRVQWVGDWQVRGTNQPGGATPTQLFPTTVQFMLYAAGTWARGNGLTLDLGVTRDSALNAVNDHTAAWSEECHLIAKFGVASRIYTASICAGGRTGIANLADCHTS